MCFSTMAKALGAAVFSRTRSSSTIDTATVLHWKAAATCGAPSCQAQQGQHRVCQGSRAAATDQVAQNLQLWLVLGPGQQVQALQGALALSLVFGLWGWEVSHNPRPCRPDRQGWSVVPCLQGQGEELVQQRSRLMLGHCQSLGPWARRPGCQREGFPDGWLADGSRACEAGKSGS